MTISRKLVASAAVLTIATSIFAVPTHAEDLPSPEQAWTAAVTAIMVRDGVDQPTANQRFLNLLTWHAAVEQIVARDGISFEQASQNLAKYLEGQESSNKVSRWHDTAIAAGWPEGTWMWQSCIIGRESGGNPSALSRTHDYGLMQINRGNVGFLRRAGIINVAADLFDPLTNLRAGLALFQESQRVHNGNGTIPWVSRKKC